MIYNFLLKNSCPFYVIFVFSLIIDPRQRASIKPAVSGMNLFSKENFTSQLMFLVVSPNPGSFENGNGQIHTPVRGGPTRLAGR